MIYSNAVELLTNSCKITVEVQRPDTDPVSAHLIHIIRLYSLIGCSIEKHPRNTMWLVAEVTVLVLHICEYLVQVGGMKRMNIKLGLRRMRVILGINDEYITTP